MIYRYINNDVKKLETVKRNLLWMSSPMDFNDPFDCNFPILKSFSAEEFHAVMQLGGQALGKEPPRIEVYQSASPTEQSQFIENYIVQFREKIASFGVHCFSEIWDSILMWSHYSDKHRGICLGYDDTKFTKDYPGVLNKVRYSTHYPDVQLGEVAQDINKMLEKYLLTKHVDWRYEREWRLIIHDEAKTRVPAPFPLKEIIFGVKIDSSIKKCICEFVDPAVNLFDAIHEPTGEYGIQRTQITAKECRRVQHRIGVTHKKLGQVKTIIHCPAINDYS